MLPAYQFKDRPRHPMGIASLNYNSPDGQEYRNREVKTAGAEYYDVKTKGELQQSVLFFKTLSLIFECAF